MNSLRTSVAIVVVGLIGPTAVAGCSSDDDDSPDVAVVTLDDDFAGDAFDAACELLERSDTGDPVATVDAVLGVLAESADVATAENTLEIAVADRCPDWQDALDAALGDRFD